MITTKLSIEEHVRTRIGAPLEELGALLERVEWLEDGRPACTLRLGVLPQLERVYVGQIRTSSEPTHGPVEHPEVACVCCWSEQENPQPRRAGAATMEAP